MEYKESGEWSMESRGSRGSPGEFRESGVRGSGESGSLWSIRSQGSGQWSQGGLGSRGSPGESRESGESRGV